MTDRDANAAAWDRALDEVRRERPELLDSAADDDWGGDDVAYWDAVETRAVQLGGRPVTPRRSAELARVQEALRELAQIDRERLRVINALRSDGLLRSRSLVGDWGELVAQALLGGELAPFAQPGFDLTDARGRRVQVKTLRSTPDNHRVSLGAFSEPFDVALCIRLDANYEPLRAFEIEAAVLRAAYPAGRASLTKRLETHAATRIYGSDEIKKALDAAV